MSTPALRSATSLAILLGGLYGTKEIGTILAPGKNTGFTSMIRGEGPQRQLVLSTSNTGDLTCWVRLRIVADTVPTGLLTARTSTNSVLALAASRADSSHWWVDISKATPSAHSLKRDKFAWASGEQIVVSVAGATVVRDSAPGASAKAPDRRAGARRQRSASVRDVPAAPAPQLVLSSPNDWIVYLANDEEDTPAKVARRDRVATVSIVLFVLLIVGTVVKTLWFDGKEDPAGPQSAAQVIRGLVDAIEVHPKERTTALRTMLKRRISGAGPREAIDAAGFDPSSRAGKAAFVEASGLLSDRMKNFREDFERLEQKLDWR